MVPVRFNPFAEDFRRDPYPLYRRLQVEDPHHRVLGMWVFTRYADVIAVLRDRRFSSSLIPTIIRKQKPAVPAEIDDPVESFIAKAIVFTENPDHARLRRLVNDCFSAEVIEAERGKYEETARRLLEPALAAGTGELMNELADPFPLHVTCDRIGIPPEARERIKGWTHYARFLLDPGLLTKKDYLLVDDAMRQFVSYVRELLPSRKAAPGSDLMSKLLAARSGEDRLSDDEVILTCIMSFVAGYETTKFLIGNAIYALAMHPAQWQLLRDNKELLPKAVDEVLRYEAPLQQTKRIALEDVEVQGTKIKSGDQVLVCLGAANRDPARFPEPNTFDITRSGAGHMGFGHGMRACLGGTLAHVETQAVLEVLSRAVGHWELTDSEPQWADHSRILRGLQRLPVRFVARGA